jgi:glucokinase
VYRNVLGVDIGGTKIAAGRVSPTVGTGMGEAHGKGVHVTGFHVTPTLAQAGIEVSLAQVWRAIERGLAGEDGPPAKVEAIGLCAPGPLDAARGAVLNPPNLPGWRNVPLVRMAEDKFGLPVRMENDCNAAGLAEALYGAGLGHSIVFYAAIGTGIGAGIIVDGKIYRGAHGAAGEAGHVTIDYRSAILCGCGTPGCIEALASRRAFDDARVFEEVEDLDELATRLAAWLGGMISVLDPGIVVIGGGVAQMGEMLFERLRTAAPRWTVNPYAREIPIVPAGLGEEAGVVGAALAVINDIP